MKKEYELAGLGIGALLTGLTSVIIAQNIIFSPTKTIQTVMLVKVFLTSLNIILLLGLTANYLKIYSSMKTPLSRSLLMFSTALLLYAVSSSPLIHVMLNFEIISIGPFTFLPDIFVTIATAIILRESYR
jgi:hypothetical protein